ncbi:ife-3 [Cordylochernes scorpioides]|uniref:eIF-4F 25 kDa subunit n=1 Tax=Cordylochernes scorpioides TaxID=51811 RepID=A0ABY6L5G0_9ARAC|nr:ife-3 [Cordylochernes scorpioides]
MDSKSKTDITYIKHPLQNKWSFWFFKNDKSRDWKENLIEINSFDTVEDFWALFNHVEVPSKIPIGCDYCMFKYGIKPMWEDSRNKLGGRWLINLGKQLRTTELDNYWKEALLCLVGEAFDHYGDIICGAVVQVRPKGDKIGIWTSDANNSEANMRIGKILRERINLHPRTILNYEAHSDTQTKTGSIAKCIYSA